VDTHTPTEARKGNSETNEWAQPIPERVILTAKRLWGVGHTQGINLDQCEKDETVINERLGQKTMAVISF